MHFDIQGFELPTYTVKSEHGVYLTTGVTVSAKRCKLCGATLHPFPPYSV